VILTATEEILSDDTNESYIADFYAMGWMYNAIDMDLNSVFLASPKLENNFIDVFLPFLLQDMVSSREQ